MISVGCKRRLVHFEIILLFGGCMKYRLMFTALLLNINLVLFASFSFAQPHDRPMPPPPGIMPLEEIIKDLKKELNLTDEQETKIKSVFEAQRIEMKKTFEAERKAREARYEKMDAERNAMREKMEKQRKDTDAKISVILTDEQKKKFEELLKKHTRRLPHMQRQEGENDMPMPEECPDLSE